MSKLTDKSIVVLDANYIDCPAGNIQILREPVILQYHNVASNGETITIVPVPNAFVYIDVTNDTPLSFNVTADVSALSLGDKVSICFRYSSLNVTNVVTTTLLQPIRSTNTVYPFVISNVSLRVIPSPSVPVAIPRYLLDLTFNSGNLMWFYEIC